jgi:tetratricopeptide (TPR) repeat protein
MKWMQIIGACLFLVLCVGSWRWMAQASAAVVQVSAEDRALAAEHAGSGLTVIREGLHPASLNAARELFEPAELEAARESLAKALTVTPPVDVDEGILHVLQSVVTRRLKDADAALEYGRRGAELLPASGDAHHVYSRAIAEQMRAGGMMAAVKNMEPWLAELRMSIELDPSNVTARSEEIFFLGFVPKLLGGNPDLAKERIAGLATVDEPTALSLEATLVGHLEDPAAGCERGAAAIVKYPENTGLALTHGILLEKLATTMELPDEKAALCTQADGEFVRAMGGERDGAYHRALYRRAQLRIDHEFDLDTAQTLLDDYLADLPRGEMLASAGRIHWRKGQIHSLQGNTDGARAAFARALELEPELAEAKKALQALTAE